MKKTTKLLLVLAAVVAMTIGAVSTVMAADVVIDTASWTQDDDGNYSAKDTSGNEIKTGWAVDAAGRWYYFQDKIALQNEFIKWRGNYYYFGKDCIMCEGWVEFTDKNAAPLDGTAYPSAAVGTILDGSKSTAYGKSVWCYFEKGGIAATDKWVDVDGLWYYFDDIIMVCDDFDYVIDKKTYGFSGDGNMHVGWIPVTSTTAATAGPTGESAKSNVVGYVYYKANGEMAGAGWNKIDGNWYRFAKNEDGSKFMAENVKRAVEEGTPVMLSNMYIKVGDECFWLTASGEMATGTVTIKKDYKYFVDVNAFMSGTTTKAKATTLVFASNGKQELGGDPTKKNVYYLQEKDANVYVVSGDYENNATVIATKNLTNVNAGNVATGSAVEVNNISATLVGDKITNAFLVHKGEVYYYDEDGNMVKNDLVDFYGLTIGFDSKGKMIKTNSDEKVKVAGSYYYFNEQFGQITVGNISAYGCSTKKPASAN